MNIDRLPSLANRLRSSPTLRAVYERLPSAIKAPYRLIASGPARLSWILHPDGKRHATEILSKLHGQFRGRRAVVMGNGPSLSNTDWRLLRDEFTIGTNRIYLLEREMRFAPDVFVCANGLVLEQFHSEIARTDSLKFIDWRVGHRFLKANRQTVFLPEIPRWRFHRDLFNGWNVGYTVTFAALQVAFHLGFDLVVLIGVDHRFSTPGPPMRAVVASEPDRDHFTTGYFDQGTRWHLPNLHGSEISYRLAHKAYLAASRRVVDATKGGALAVFPRVSLAEALSDA